MSSLFDADWRAISPDFQPDPIGACVSTFQKRAPPAIVAAANWRGLYQHF
jgi:hypothetical protein